MDTEALQKTTDLNKLIATLEHIPFPAFLIEVEDEKLFRYVSLNDAHMLSTGLDISHVKGRTPSEFFPERLADTVTENYRRCIASRSVITYEELLSLPNGETSWVTSISPIFEDEKIIALLGVSSDNTQARETEKRLAMRLEKANLMNENLKVISDAFANNLRHPLQEAGIIGDMVLEGFEDLGDNKLQMLEKSKKIIESAIDQTEAVIQSTRTLENDPSNRTQTHFGMWCLEIIALLDPSKKLDFFFPQIDITCERFILDIALRKLIEVAVHNADSRISVDVIEVGEQLVFSVQNDGINIRFDTKKPLEENQKTGSLSSKLISAKRLIEACGGSMWIEQQNDIMQSNVMTFKIDGRMIEPHKKYMYMHAA